MAEKHLKKCSTFFCLFVCLFFRDRVSLYSPGCPGTHFVDQADLELRNPPASASWVLGLKACATTAQLCSTLLVIREMQIKTILKFYLTPVRMAKIKNSSDSRCWWGCGERGTFLHCCWDGKLVQPLWKSFWQFLRKLDIVLPEDLAIPLLGIYPEDVPTCNKDTCSTMFIAV